MPTESAASTPTMPPNSDSPNIIETVSSSDAQFSTQTTFEPGSEPPEPMKGSKRRGSMDLLNIVDRVRADLDDVDVRDVAERGKEWIRQNPVAAAAAAVALGVAVGSLLSIAAKDRNSSRSTGSRLKESVTSIGNILVDNVLRDVGDVSPTVDSTSDSVSDRVSTHAKVSDSPVDTNLSLVDAIRDAVAKTVVKRIGSWLRR